MTQIFVNSVDNGTVCAEWEPGLDPGVGDYVSLTEDEYGQWHATYYDGEDADDEGMVME